MSFDLIRAKFAIIDAGEWDRLGEVFHPDSVYERPAYEPLEGFDAIFAFYTGARKIRAGRHTLDTVIHEGDEAATSGRFVGELKTGEAVDFRFAEFYRLEGNLIVRCQSYFFTPLV